MKVFLLGDTQSPDGPGIANAAIAEALRLHHVLSVSRARSHAARCLEAVAGILGNDITVICSMSNLNRFAFRFAGWLHKPVCYIMHGYASLESVLNGATIPGTPEHLKLLEYDRLVLSRSSRVICVSRFAAGRLEQDFPKYADKLEHITNAVLLPPQQSIEAGNGIHILSVGADQKIKNCVPLAIAVCLLRQAGADCTLILVGKKCGEYETLCHMDGILWKEPVPRRDLLQLMRTCNIYVQNSLFDTFAMAPLEALLMGSSVLISDRVGCKDLLPGLLPEEIITDPSDPEEIAEAIRGLTIRGGNRKRLLTGSFLRAVSLPALAGQLDTILQSAVKRR